MERFILPVAEEPQAASFHGHSRSGIRQEPEIAFRNGTAYQHHVRQSEKAMEPVAVFQGDGKQIPAGLAGGNRNMGDVVQVPVPGSQGYFLPLDFLPKIAGIG